jgi:hypothetical protein
LTSWPISSASANAAGGSRAIAWGFPNQEPIGVPAASLNKNCAHAFRAVKQHNILRDLDYAMLKDKFDLHCSSLREELFPGYNLRDFLAHQARPRPDSVW